MGGGGGGGGVERDEEMRREEVIRGEEGRDSTSRCRRDRHHRRHSHR